MTIAIAIVGGLAIALLAFSLYMEHDLVLAMRMLINFLKVSEKKEEVANELNGHILRLWIILILIIGLLVLALLK